MSQSTQSDPGMPCTSRDQGRELEELVHRQASALAEAPQLGEAELVAQLGLGVPVREQQRAGPEHVFGVVGPHALGPVPGIVLVRDQAAPQLLGIRIELQLGLRCDIVPALVELLHRSPSGALRADRPPPPFIKSACQMPG